jgi:dienelactone hydrolase
MTHVARVAERNSAVMLCAGILLICFVPAHSVRGAEEPADSSDLTVLPADVDGVSTKQMLGRYLKQQAYDALQRRREAYEKVKTPEQAVAWQERLRAEFIEHLGGFPERTPLNAIVVGTLDGDGYRIEKLIYESQPQHHVTAILYLPKSKPPFPAVVVPCGHSSSGKAAQQRICILLAKNGIAALSYDPIGQAERVQLLDEDGKARFRMTTEHTLVGAGSIPLGRGTATFRIWDGMRTIDYLTSRPEIDHERIGVTGCSGGGTLTSYLMALDDRVVCAAPSCYITSWRRLIDTIGPQDAEQNIHGQLAFGMDHADYLLMRAPKPTLILASTHDFFDIDGAWDSFRQAKRFYTRLGAAERVNLVETDAKHGYPKLQREAMVRWMRRWLLDIDEPVTEPDFETRPSQELQCTMPGQVLLLSGSRSVVDLNIELNEQLKKQRQNIWRSGSREVALDKVRQLAGIRKLADLPRPVVTDVGTVERNGYSIGKLVIRPEDGIQLPALLFKPARASGRRVLYLHADGKQADSGLDGPIDTLVRAGDLVLSVDLRGTGETGPSSDNTWGGDWNSIFLSYLLGRSLVGMRTEDVLCAARYLQELDGKSSGKVHLVAVGAAGIPAVHAAAVERSLFASLRLTQPKFTWSDVVRDPGMKGQLAHTVHGALRVYDLDNLAAAFEVTVEPQAPSGR